MPVLSLHNNTYATLPSGSASYTLGLSGAPGGASSYTYPSAGISGIGASASVGNALGNILGGGTSLGGGGVGTGNYASILGTVGGLSGLGTTNPLSSNLAQLGTGFNAGTSYSTYTNPLLSGGVGSINMKMKAYDDLDLLGRSFGTRTGTTPNSPIPPANWGLDSYSAALDGVNPTFMHTHSRHGLDLDGENRYINSEFRTQTRLYNIYKSPQQP